MCFEALTEMTGALINVYLAASFPDRPSEDEIDELERSLIGESAMFGTAVRLFFDRAESELSKLLGPRNIHEVKLSEFVGGIVAGTVGFDESRFAHLNDNE